MPPKGAAKGTDGANTSKKRKNAGSGDEAAPSKKARQTSASVLKRPSSATLKGAVVERKNGLTLTPKKRTESKLTAKEKETQLAKRKAHKTSQPESAPVKKEVKKEAKKETKKEVVEKAPVTKKVAAEPKPKTRKKGEIINQRPTDALNVFVFGENSSGELGLGATGNVIDVKRPRLNPLLKERKIVAIAAGGMHQAFLTADGKILTCGVNDQGALGRDTAGAEKLRDMDDDNASDAGSDNGLNALEATPSEMDMKDVPEDTVFTSIVAGDSITLAVTDEGLVYACGTFRSNDGILGFSKDVTVQRTLIQVEGLKNIKTLSCGANHVLALDKKGSVFAWGSGQQNQLGRRIVERTKFNGLRPSEFGLPKRKVTGIYAGAYHSFATDTNGKVWAWGLNSYGETGIEDNAGEDDAVVHTPTVVQQLSNRGVSHLSGGMHHSLAITAQNECLVWGRMDGFQTGIKASGLPDEDIIRDDHGKARILKKPTVLSSVGEAVYGDCGTDQAFAINKDGKCFAWGFSVNYQTGLGTSDDVEEATLIDNTATRDEKLIWAGAGGQYGVLASVQH